MDADWTILIFHIPEPSDMAKIIKEDKIITFDANREIVAKMIELYPIDVFNILNQHFKKDGMTLLILTVEELAKLNKKSNVMG